MVPAPTLYIHTYHKCDARHRPKHYHKLGICSRLPSWMGGLYPTSPVLATLTLWMELSGFNIADAPVIDHRWASTM